METTVSFRTAQLNDLAAMQQLYVDTIMTVCARDYTDEQLKIWASGIENIRRWEDVISGQYCVLAEISGKLAGYATLHNGTYIDLFYVSRDFQGQGIAGRIMQQINEEAIRLGASELTANVSITARPFFEHCGFEMITEQHNLISGVDIINYRMRKMMS
jgi:putative acetyltransferase